MVLHAVVDWDCRSSCEEHFELPLIGKSGGCYGFGQHECECRQKDDH